MYTQQYQFQERFPYVEAPDYTKMDSILEAFPHLQGINQERDWSKMNNIYGVVIRSANDDNVHKVPGSLFRP